MKDIQLQNRRGKQNRFYHFKGGLIRCRGISMVHLQGEQKKNSIRLYIQSDHRAIKYKTTYGEEVETKKEKESLIREIKRIQRNFWWFLNKQDFRHVLSPTSNYSAKPFFSLSQNRIRKDFFTTTNQTKNSKIHHIYE